MSEFCLHIAINAPVRHGYDYLPLPDEALPVPGVRVRVPFGRQMRLGIVQEIRSQSSHARELKPIAQVLDESPVLDSQILELLVWAAHYYRHPIGQVLAAALPARLRRGGSLEVSGMTRWQVTEQGRQEALDDHQRAPVRQAVLRALQEHPEGLGVAELQAVHKNYAVPLKALIQRQLVTLEVALPAPSSVPVPRDVPHSSAQLAVIDSLRQQLGAFSCTLLHGVTGSGKTEVYRAVIRTVLEQGGQALVLAPEIGLAPQLRERLAQDANTRVEVYHSQCTERERHLAWLRVQSGQTDLVVGTRSAVFLPFRDLRLIVVDEEHDPSFKQQEGFRYHARDVAVFRAHRGGFPVILGTATPSIETWRNAQAQRYQLLSLPTRVGSATLPDTEIIDLNQHSAPEGLSEPLLHALRETLDRGEQALLFLNRRGFAPVLYAPQQEGALACPHCSVYLTYHRSGQRLICHFCGYRQDAYPLLEQGAQLLGEGTQRVEERLQMEFPGEAILRLDRDNIRGRRALEENLQRMRRGDYSIIIGTQLLCKGHDFPNVTLVGIVNMDSQLFSPRLRAPERMAQVLVQVSGRAGRHRKPGRVLLQTALPHHPLLHQLLHESYEDWLARLMAERQRLGLPPYRHWALVQARHKDYAKAEKFLRDVKKRAEEVAGCVALGPAPALMRRQAGQWQVHLLLRSNSRKVLEQGLDQWLSQPRDTSRVRWTLDIDPLDIT